MTGAVRRWLFADQLGPHFLADPAQPVLLVESARVLARRRFHRQKAHLTLSALRHRAAELGDQARHVRVERYADALGRERLEVAEPTSYGAERLVTKLTETRPGFSVVPSPGFACHRSEFGAWARSRRDAGKRLLMEDFYREQRRRFDVLMDHGSPIGGTWNLDHDNREAPPKGARTLTVPEPWWPEEDGIDAQVRLDLDEMESSGAARFSGKDGPRRFAVTRDEALQALHQFVSTRLPAFGPHEDAMLAADATMAHSLLSVPLNLGLLHPLEVVAAAEAAYRSGAAPLAGVEGFIRQVLGWREYVWGIYWQAGEQYQRRNALAHRRTLPGWFDDLDADAVTANCLSHVLADVRDRGWVHHIPRLMILGGYALQRGWSPQELTDWFHERFVDGYGWVMTANVVGMSQQADGGLMATKPYASGGAYINRMSDFCSGCAYDPKVRLGPKACPYTAGYWAFIDRHAHELGSNPRMSRAVQGRLRLDDLTAVIAQEKDRGKRRAVACLCARGRWHHGLGCT